MSGYYNKMKGGNDPKPKKKKIRTNHPTWGEILGSQSVNKKRAKKLKEQMKKKGA